MLHKITIILTVFLLFACSNRTTVSGIITSGGKQLSAVQILEMVENNTLLLNSFELNSYFFFAQSGELFAKDINNNKDVGRWDVSDTDELCLKLKNWWYGELNCYNVWSDNETYHLANSDGLLLFSARQGVGDSQSLFFETKKQAQSIRKSIRTQKILQNDSHGSKTPPNSPSSKKKQPVIAENTKNKISASYDYTDATLRMLAKDCPGCNLSFSNLQGADLAGANLANANLAGADLSGANLRRANLHGANLEDANLAYADMPGADLTNSNLKNANLKGANLYKADLTGASLTGTNLQQ